LVIWQKLTQISNFTKFHLVGAELFHASRETERQTDKQTWRIWYLLFVHDHTYFDLQFFLFNLHMTPMFHAGPIALKYHYLQIYFITMTAQENGRFDVQCSIPGTVFIHIHANKCLFYLASRPTSTEDGLPESIKSNFKLSPLSYPVLSNTQSWTKVTGTNISSTVTCRSGAVCWDTALQAGRWRVRFTLVSLELFIDIILPAALWSWGWLSL
jgi:hypothetical protein